jgi:predicted pyridoxine 5'-phosphate oxidase superfamily flavin-nucleotide-binding protein
MANLNDEMKEMFEKKKFAIVGTASKKGIPNAVAMGSPMVLDDETLCFACVAEGKTFNNLRENPNVAITVVDAEVFQQHQIKGMATIETSGPLFEKFKELMTPFNVVPKCAVKVSVDEIFSLR